MKLQPRNNRILIEQIILADSNIVMPEGVANPLGYWKVHAIAPDVIFCAVGDSILIRPDANILGVDDDRRIGLADAGVVIAVVTNCEKEEIELDTKPTTGLGVLAQYKTE